MKTLTNPMNERCICGHELYRHSQTTGKCQAMIGPETTPEIMCEGRCPSFTPALPRTEEGKPQLLGVDITKEFMTRVYGMTSGGKTLITRVEFTPASGSQEGEALLPKKEPQPPEAQTPVKSSSVVPMTEKHVLPKKESEPPEAPLGWEEELAKIAKSVFVAGIVPKRMQEAFAVFIIRVQDFFRAEIDRINKQWSEWGIIEIAVRNPQVAEYMEHWEGRAEKAEKELSQAIHAERARIKEKLETLPARIFKGPAEKHEIILSLLDPHDQN